MTIGEILQKMVDEGDVEKLSSSNGPVKATDLLQTLSPPVLATQAHIQPGLYIAEINEQGYLGRVLFKFAK